MEVRVCLKVRVFANCGERVFDLEEGLPPLPMIHTPGLTGFFRRRWGRVYFINPRPADRCAGRFSAKRAVSLMRSAPDALADRVIAMIEPADDIGHRRAGSATAISGSARSSRLNPARLTLRRAASAVEQQACGQAPSATAVAIGDGRDRAAARSRRADQSVRLHASASLAVAVVILARRRPPSPRGAEHGASPPRRRRASGQQRSRFRSARFHLHRQRGVAFDVQLCAQARIRARHSCSRGDRSSPWPG